MVVLMTGSGGAALWFALPRFRADELGGVFTLSVDVIPPQDSFPEEEAEGRFWLVNLGPQTIADARQPSDYPLQQDLRAIYKVCTQLGCLYKWAGPNDQFECPCHGSKFLKTGARTDGPARRNLDLFMIEVLDEAGEVSTRTESSLEGREGTSVQLPREAVSLRIDTGRRVLGAPNSKRGGGI